MRASPSLRKRLGLAFVVLALFGFPGRIAAQEGEGRFITEASVRLTRLVATANKQGYGLQENAFSTGGAWVKQSKDNWVVLYTVKLEEGKKYRFLAAGDEDAKDVDLQVLDADGKVVAQDVKSDPEAVVDFTAAATGSYVVRIRLFDSENNVPCFCLALVMTKMR